MPFAQGEAATGYLAQNQVTDCKANAVSLSAGARGMYACARERAHSRARARCTDSQCKHARMHMTHVCECAKMCMCVTV